MPHYPALVLHFDGSCFPVNPGGVCTFGWHIDTPDGKRVNEESGVCTDRPDHERTNNLAEWEGLCDALQWLEEAKVTAGRLLIRGDSMLVINQMAGRWKIKAAHLRELYKEATRRLKAVCPSKRWQAVWIPREQNARADKLSRQAIGARYD